MLIHSHRKGYSIGEKW